MAEHVLADGRACPCGARNVTERSEVASLTHAQMALHGNRLTRLRAVLDVAEFGALEVMAREFMEKRTGWPRERLLLASPSTVLEVAFEEAMRS